MSEEIQSFDESKKASGFVLTKAIIDFADKSLSNMMLLMEKRIKEHSELDNCSDAAKELVSDIAIWYFSKQVERMAIAFKEANEINPHSTAEAAQDEIKSYKRMLSILDKTTKDDPKEVILARSRLEALEIVKKRIEEAEGEAIPPLSYHVFNNMKRG